MTGKKDGRQGGGGGDNQPRKNTGSDRKTRRESRLRRSLRGAHEAAGDGRTRQGSVIAGTISGLSIPHFCEWCHGQRNHSPSYEGKHDLWYERHAAHGPMLERKAQGGSS